MGLLDNLERGIEKAVRGAFSGRGGRAIGPVEIAAAVRRHMDQESFTMSEGRSFVPNVYKIRLAESDFGEAKKYGVALAEELCEEIIRHADSQGYTLLGPVKATFVKNTELKPGQLSIESRTDKNSSGAPPAQTRRGPAAGPTAAAPLPRTVAQAPVAPPATIGVLDHDGIQHTLRAPVVTVGRSTSADITVSDTGVSRKHVQITRQGSSYLARDLGSTNGTYLNGEPLQGEVELTDGALITLGNARLRFRLSPGA